MYIMIIASLQVVLLGFIIAKAVPALKDNNPPSKPIMAVLSTIVVLLSLVGYLLK